MIAMQQTKHYTPRAPRQANTATALKENLMIGYKQVAMLAANRAGHSCRV